MPDVLSADPNIYVEQKRSGYIRYRNRLTGRRWEVRGTCDRRGDCLIGAVIDGTLVRDHAHLLQLVQQVGKLRIDSEEDVPVSPEFNSCCGDPVNGRFTYEELPPLRESGEYNELAPGAPDLTEPLTRG